MRFLLFSFSMPELLKDTPGTAGGASVQWKSWIKGFKDNGHEFGLLTYKGAAEYINLKLDFDIVECYDPKKGIKKLRILYYQIPAIYKAIKKYKPDYVIQVSASAHTGMVMIACKILSIPIIHRIASDVHVNEQLTLIEKREIFLYKLGLKHSDFISTQNSYQFNKLKHKYPGKNIFIIHNPYILETNEGDILPRDRREYISWIGHFRYIKNLPALTNVAKELAEIKFKIAGVEYPDLDEETRKSIIELKQLKNVEFVGYLRRDGITSFLSKSIALINTSLNEGFSNTFLESWSAGVPVVTTTNVNPDEIVSKFNLGEVADNFDQLAFSLKRIINLNSAAYNKLASHCYNYVKEKHDPKILAEEFVSYLNMKNKNY